MASNDVNDILCYEENTEEKVKRWVKQQIQKGVIQHQSLEKTKEAIEKGDDEIGGISLSPKEESYIREKYLKYCSVELKDKTANLIKRNISGISENLLAFISSLKKWDTRTNCKDFFGEIIVYIELTDNYVSIMAILVNFEREISITQKQNIVVELQQIIWKILLENVTHFSVETDFVRELKQYMRHCFLHGSIVTLTRGIDLTGSKETVCKMLITNISSAKYDNNICTLQNLANFVSDKYSEYFQKDIKLILEQYTYPLSVTLSSQNDKMIIKCTGKYVDLKEAVELVESELKDNNPVQEIDIVATQVLRANFSFSWPGINAVILAEEIYVEPDLNYFEFDVSGKDASEYSTKADDGRKAGDDGCPGKHGNHGESAGNVCIITSKIVHSEKLVIKANGGNASDGQAGGDGMKGIDGENGKGLTVEQFKEQFPDICHFVGATADRSYQQNIDNTEIKTLDSFPDGEVVKMESADGNDIKLGYYNESLDGSIPKKFVLTYAYMFGICSGRQSYCIHYGTKGTMGTRGGDGGCGGIPGFGGYAGSIQVVHRRTCSSLPTALKKECKDGLDGCPGPDGKGAQGGKNGIKGIDNARVESHHYRSGIYYHGHLEINYVNNGGVDRAYCPKKKKYAKIVEMDSSRNPSIAKCGVTGKITSHHKQEQRVRKPPIHADTVLDRFSDLLQEDVSRIADSCTISESDLELVTTGLSEFESSVGSIGQQQTQQQVAFHDSTASSNHSNHCTIEVTYPAKTTQMNPSTPDMSRIKLLKSENAEFSSILQDLSNVSCVADLIKQLEVLQEALQKKIPVNQDTAALQEVFCAFHENVQRVILTKEEALIAYKCFQKIEENLTTSPILTENSQYIKKLTQRCKNILSSVHLRYILATLLQLSREIDIRIVSFRETRQCDSENYVFEILSKENTQTIVDSYLQVNDLKLMSDIDEIIQRVLERVNDDYLRNVLDSVLSNHSSISDGYFHFLPGFSTSDLKDAPSGVNSSTNNAQDIHTEHTQTQRLNFNLEPEVEELLSSLKFVPTKGIEEFTCILRHRLSYEGLLISMQEIKWLLTHVMGIKRSKDMYTLIYVICTRSQPLWLYELLVYQLTLCINIGSAKENPLRKFVYKIKCRGWVLFMSQSQKGDNLTVNDIKEVVDFIKDYDIDESINSLLKKIPLSEWPYKLKFMEIYRELSKIPIVLDESQYTEAASAIWDLQNKSGKNLTRELTTILQNDADLTPTVFLSLLCNFRVNRWTLEERTLAVLREVSSQSWFEHLNAICCLDRDRTIDELIESMEKDSNNSLTKEYLTKIKEIVKDIGNMQNNTSNILPIEKNIGCYEKGDIRLWAEAFKKSPNRDACLKENFEEVLSIVKRGIALETKCELRNTQIITLVLFARNEDRGILQQVSTGEGKSLIIVALSVIKYLSRQTVDVITSSPVLAKRDAEQYRNIYDMFGATVSHNCCENSVDRKKSYQMSIVYGEIGSFQRDILLDEFYNENMLGDRKNENIIVDEVDSMLLDKGQNVLYLSHHIPGLDTLEQVYVYIWSFVHSKALSKQLCRTEYDIELVKTGMMGVLYGYLLRKEDLAEAFSSDQSASNVKCLWNYLLSKDIINASGTLLIHQDIASSPGPYRLEVPEHILSSDQAGIVSCILRDVAHRGPEITVPKFLDNFIQRHLESWIRNAFKARTMQEGEQYIIDRDRENDLGKPANVIIIDTETGAEQYNSQWNQGLHQFLQLKHGCRLSVESLKAVFISNITFFKRYLQQIYGLTGTLGSERERNLLQKLYDIDYITIPTFRPSRFIELNTIVCEDQSTWRTAIVRNAKEESQMRPVLVICETIRDVEKIEKAFRQQKVSFDSYKRSYEEINILKEGESAKKGCILLATNLAGRGTDIKIDENLNDVGGLHVILTYLPSNIRIEQQAFGRAARKGQKGSGQMIICQGRDSVTPISSEILKLNRNWSEEQRIGQIKTHFEKNIEVEEKLFKTFSDTFKNLRKSLTNKKCADDLQSLILFCCLDDWAFWLDIVQESLEEKKDVSWQQEHTWIEGEKMKEAIESADVPLNLVNGLQRRIRLGQIKISRKEYDSAIDVFDRIIDDDPNIAEAAHYYKAHCLIKQTKYKSADFRQHLQSAEHLLNRRIDEQSTMATIVKVIGDKLYGGSETFLPPDDYLKQKEGVISLYKIFLRSIQQIEGVEVLPFMFHGDITPDPVHARFIYEDLKKTGILTEPSFTSDAEQNYEHLKEYYGVYFTELMCKIDSIKTSNTPVRATSFVNILPSREDFWKTLKESGVLHEDKAYVIVNTEKIKSSVLLDTSVKQRLTQSSTCPDLYELIQQDFRPGGQYKYPCLLHPINLNDRSEIIVFTQSNFESQFGPYNNWKYFDEEKVLSLNKRAYIENNPAKVLTKFDVIGHDAFKIYTENDIQLSREIFHQLVKEQIISASNPARLLNYDLTCVDLGRYREYRTEVIHILKKHFEYRLALNDFFSQNQPQLSAIGLETNPHELLFNRMIYHKIICPGKVDGRVNVEDILKKLEMLYGGGASVYDFARRQLGMVNVLERTVTPLLDTFDQQLNKMPTISTTDIPSYRQHAKQLTDIFVKVPNSDQLKLKCKREELDGINEALAIPTKMLLFSRLHAHDMVQNIYNLLISWTSTLQRYREANPELIELQNALDRDTYLEMSEEIKILFENGLDRTITVGEKKWTYQTNMRIAGAVTIGLGQIIASACLEMYTIGAGTHLASGLMSEGFGDIFFGIQSAASGFCSVEAYWKHKKISLAMTALTMGVGAVFSRGAQFSRYQHKIGGQYLTTMSGKELIKEVGIRRLGKEICYRAGKKICEASMLGFGTAGMDCLIENLVRQHVQEVIVEKLFLNLNAKLKEMPFRTKIRELYKHFGKKETERLIQIAKNNIIKNKEQDESMLMQMGRLIDSLYKGYAEASRKNRRSGTVQSSTSIFQHVTSILPKVIGIGIKLKSVYGLSTITNNLLAELIEELDQLAKSSSYMRIEEKKGVDDAFEALMLSDLKKFVSKKVEEKITKEYIKPLSQQVVTSVTKFTKKVVKEQYTTFKSWQDNKQFNKLQKQLKENLAKIKENNNGNNDMSTMENDVKAEHEKRLTELLQTTKNPELFAKIIKEGVPLGVHSCQAVSELIGRPIIITDADGKSITFDPSDVTSEEAPIELNFRVGKDGIGLFSKSIADVDPENITPEEVQCLFTAVLSLTEKQVTRIDIANKILSSPSIQDGVRRGLHEHFMSKGIAGVGLVHCVNTYPVPNNVQELHQLNIHGEFHSYWSERSDRQTQISCLELNCRTIEYNFVDLSKEVRICEQYVVSPEIAEKINLKVAQSSNAKEGIVSGLAEYVNLTDVKAKQEENIFGSIQAIGFKVSHNQQNYFICLNRERFKAFRVAKLFNNDVEPPGVTRPILPHDDPYVGYIESEINNAKSLEDIGKLFRNPAHSELFQTHEIDPNQYVFCPSPDI